MPAWAPTPDVPARVFWYHPIPLPAMQLRYVMLPGKTDQPEDVAALIQFCRNKRSMQAIEVLPYHLLGVEVRWGAASAAPRCAGQPRQGLTGCSRWLVCQARLPSGMVL